MSNVLKNIPSVNELLERPPLRKLVDRANRNVVVSGVRRFLDNLRTEVKNAAADVNVPTPGELAERIAKWISDEDTPNLRPVINATGILLHTGLGRAPLAEPAVEAIVAIARGYASVEVDVETGERSQRVRDAEKLLKQITGAEAAVVVNNNAGATLLTLAALAAGREVIVARGQLVEIGGSFRLPNVMEFSGAKLREVGTTNKTRIEDYRAAIRQETAALMRVHASNYAIVGFTEQASLAELVDLGSKRNLPVIDDIGSGAMEDVAAYGLTDEPVVTESIKTGADVVLFSGDKLFGGPQCGIIVGKKSSVEKIAKHPLMRALRVDKITLAALVETLRLHQDRETAKQSLPLMSLLNTSVANLQNRAERMAPQLAASSAVKSAEPIESFTYLGGGSIPAQQIPTWCVALEPDRGSVDTLAATLRKGVPCVFGRIHKDRLLLDLRSVFPKQDMQIVEAVQQLGGGVTESAPAE
ncbi:MAG: L-seryl-tRNA(Sec) selenium transferase [Planctomycetes bacterium]|nr:L-seryl-tRNA(Sec) selenium transferase [Planctomycetota bacterium]MBL7041860.1 L-seryl-tRNA(Sec) selenium transferase [Pirellulaceae bacterium]